MIILRIKMDVIPKNRKEVSQTLLSMIELNVLLFYPKFPDTFWSLNDALRVIRKKAAFSPLGLLIVAALLPDEFQKRPVDVNLDCHVSPCFIGAVHNVYH